MTIGTNAEMKQTPAFAIPHFDDSPGAGIPKKAQQKQVIVPAKSCQKRIQISRTELHTNTGFMISNLKDNILKKKHMIPVSS
jgi:hypothetical protein